jgi:carbonic anhydrase/acetyltransferase-like protein (isoleucine patch superfamily)
LTIGSRTGINFTTLIDAAERIEIGDRVGIGPYCVISDAVLGASGEVVETAPITIEDDAWLASRVTVLPGSHIGAGAVITAGSIVSGTVPPRVVAGGIPARVLRRLDDGVQDDTVDAGVSACVDDATDELEATLPTRSTSSLHGALAPTATAFLISDFTIDSLAPKLAVTTPAFGAELAPFGAVVPSLIIPPTDQRDLAVVWTRPELALSTMRAALDARRR